MIFSTNKDPLKIIQLQIILKFSLFSKLEHYKCIALIEIFLQCAVFDELKLHTYKHKIAQSAGAVEYTDCFSAGE